MNQNGWLAGLLTYLQTSVSIYVSNIIIFVSFPSYHFKYQFPVKMKSRNLNTPRHLNSKSSKHLTLTGLNSYKIDTTSLQQRAKQVELLKNELSTQISQYKTSEQMFYQETAQLISQNKELKANIKKLQSQLNRVRSELTQRQRTSETSDLKAINSKASQLQVQMWKLCKKLKKKDQQIGQLEQYKKMYQIQVQNKNNIMNFYESKLEAFKNDKMALISKYQQKISVLGSGLQFNGTVIHASNNHIQSNTANKDHSSQVYNSQIDPRSSVKSKVQQVSTSSSRNIKFIRHFRQNTLRQSNTQNQTSGRLQKQVSQKQFKYATPNLLAVQSNKQLSRKQNIMYSSNTKNIIPSSTTNVSAQGPNSTQGPNKGTYNKTKVDNSFLNLVRQIYNNLRRQNLKTQNLKNFNSIKNFININSPSQTQITQLFQLFPFAPIQMHSNEMQLCIDKMKKHLIKKYQTFSGNLLIEIIIDKIEDFQIAYQVNSQDQGQIIAGLSSDQDDA